MKYAKIHIKNLTLRAIIGVNDWERKEKQDIIINICLKVNAEEAIKSDNIEKAVNYRTLTKTIIDSIESTDFFLLEKLVDHVLSLILKNPDILQANVKIEKPHALRFADSVGVEMTRDNRLK